MLILLTLKKKKSVLDYNSMFSNFPDGGIVLRALLTISAPYIYPTTQCHLHFTDYDMLLEALFPRFFSVSYGMPLIS